MKGFKKLMILLITCIMVLESSSGIAFANNDYAEVIWVDVVTVSTGYLTDFVDGMAIDGNRTNNFGYIDSYGNVIKYADSIAVKSFKDGIGYIKNQYSLDTIPINRKGESLALVEHSGYWYESHPDYDVFFKDSILTDRYGRSMSPYKLSTMGYGYSNPDYITVIKKDDETSHSTSGTLALNYNGEILASTIKDGNKSITPHLNDTYKLIEAQDRDTNKFGYYNYSGKLIIPFICDRQTKNSEGIYAINSNKKSGYMDLNGNIITPLIYDSALDFENGFGVVHKDGKSALVNKNGKIVSSFIHGHIENYRASEGMAPVSQIDKFGNQVYGYVSADGKTIPSQYEYVDTFSEGLAAVSKNGKWGYINKAGSVVISFKYDEGHEFNGSYAKVALGGKFGMIDKKGNVSLPYEYSNINKLHNYYDLPTYHYIASKDSKDAIYDNNLKLIIPANYKIRDVYDPLVPDSEKILVMENSAEKLALFGVDGKQRTEFKYDIIPWGANGIRAYMQGELWGILDIHGNEITPPIYDAVNTEDIRIRNTAWAKVKKDGKYGFIDKEGAVVLPIEFDEIRPFNEGLTWVRQGIKWGIVKDPNKYESYSSWAKESIEEAKEKDLVPYECDGYFTKSITRLQFASLVTNLAEEVTGKRITPASLGQFKDTRADAALRAYSAGIVTGSGNDYTFAPESPVTREQAATMLYRTAKYIEQNTGKNIISGSKDLDSYLDQGQVSSWAREAISALAGSGIMEGTSKTTLSPSNKTSIEEAIILALRIYNNI